MTEPPARWDPPDLDALRAERARPGPSPEVEARMVGRLQDALGAMRDDVPRATTSRAWSASPVGRVVTHLVALSVGVAVGTQLPRASQPPSVRVVVPAPAPQPPPPAPVAQDAHVPTAPSLPSPPTRAAPARDASVVRPQLPPAPDPAGDLAAETALLDRAHAALARGDAARALEAADAHARAFPRGQLAENRESVAVQALVHLGRNTEARARGATFRRRWPRGMLREQVDNALRSISETDSGGALQPP